MKFTNPRTISAFTAIVVTITALVINITSSLLLYDRLNVWVVLIFMAVLAPLSYLILNHLLNTFIWNKIKIIYKNIFNLKAPKGPDGKSRRKSILHEKDIIEKVNEQVLEWSDDYGKEIEQLKHLETYRREFIGNVSHELKTPIFNIQGYILTLLDGGIDDPEINKEYLKRSEKSIDRMISIVNDLDAITKLESGTLKLSFKEFDVVELVKEVFEFLDIKATERNISLYIGTKSDKPIKVIADRDKIKQVLINLIDNSLKYGGKDDGKTKVSFFDMDEHLLVEVTDNGPGIPQEELPRIFERFYRSEMARHTRQGGSGLGLSIVKHILEAHNQTINVRSTVGIGTTFAFTIKKAKTAFNSTLFF